jgi:hypothetical protein
MTTKQQEHVAKSAGPPKNEDRFTLVLTTHFLEWDTGATTDVRWAYDRLSPTGTGTCFQTQLRSNPGKKQKVTLPEDDCSKFEIILGHKTPQLSGDDPLMQEQQKLNVIEIWDEEKQIGSIAPDRMMFGQFKGPLYFISTRTTAILSVTAFPV